MFVARRPAAPYRFLTVLALLLGLFAMQPAAATAPTVTSASLTGITLTVTFSENMDTNSVPAVASSVWALLVLPPPTGGSPSVSAHTLSGSTATLTLSGAISDSSTAHLLYTKGTDNNFKDLEGNELANIGFPQVPITVNTPDTTAPTIQSVAVVADQLTVFFDEDMDATSRAANSAWIVNVGGTPRSVTSYTLSEDTAVLTLSSAVSSSDIVTIAYMQPTGTDPKLQDLAGNALATASAQTVTNNTDDTKPTLASATVNGTTLTVTFSETMDSTSRADNGAWSVTISSGGGTAPGINSYTLSGTTATLTLSSAVGANQNITISYDKSAAGSDKLQDRAGNELDTFTNRGVHNLLGDSTAPEINNAVVNGRVLIVNFSETMASTKAVDTAWSVDVTPGANDPSVSSYTLSGSTATLTLDRTISSSGAEVKLTYTQPGSGGRLQDLAGNPLATIQQLTVLNTTGMTDTTAPTITGITRQQPTDSPTGADDLTWRVAFSEVVSNVDSTDFTVSGAGLITPNIAVSAVPGSNTWNVNISGGNLADYNGTITLGLASAQNIVDAASNALSSTLPGGAGIVNTFVLNNTIPPGLMVSPDNLTITEGNSSNFSVTLRAAPSADVTVTLTKANADVTVTPSTLNFTTTNWDTGQSVAVSTVADADSNDDSDTISLSASGGGYDSVTGSVAVTIIEADTTAPTITAIARRTFEVTNADSLTWQVVFSEVVSNVDSTDFTVSGAGLTTPTISVDGSNTVYNISASGGNLAGYNGTVTLSLASNQNITDSAGNALSSTLPGSVTNTYVLDNTAPTITGLFFAGPPITRIDNPSWQITFSEALVNLDHTDFTFSGSGGSLGATSAVVEQTLIANRWNVTISGGNLANYNGAVTLGLASNHDITDVVGVVGNALDTALPADASRAYILDNTVPTITGASVNDTTLTVTFSEILSSIKAVDSVWAVSVAGNARNVTGYTLNDSTATLTLASAVTDGQAVTLSYTRPNAGNKLQDRAGNELADVSSRTVTNDTRGLTIDPTSVDVTEGGSGTFTVKLTAQPTGTVTVAMAQSGTSNSDISLDQATLTFTTSNWDTTQTVTVRAAEDADTANDSASIGLTASGGGYDSISGSVSVTATDNDTPGLTISPSSVNLTEGSSHRFSVNLTTQPSASVTVAVAVSGNSDITLDVTNLVFTTSNYNIAQSVTVRAAQDSDGVNDSASIILRATDGGYDNITGSLAVNVTDDDIPGLTLSPDSLSLNEGGSGNFTVSLTTQPTGTVTVTVAQPGNSDVTVDTNSGTNGNQTTLTFTTSNYDTAQSVTVSAAQDNDADDDSARISLTASGGGYDSATGSVSVTVTDDDSPNLIITPPSNLNITEGSNGNFTVMLATQPTATVTVTVAQPGNSDVTVDTNSSTAGNQTTLTFTTTNYNTAQSVTVSAIEDSDGVDDSARISLTAAGGDYASVTGSLGVSVADITAPRITSITRQTPATSPTREDTLTWRLTFNEAVSNVDGNDFSVSGAGTPSISVAQGSSGTVWDVTASGGTLAGLTGTVTLGLSSAQNITDSASNALDSTLPDGAENTYVLDNTAPVVSSVEVNGDTLTVTFNETMADSKAANDAWIVSATLGDDPNVSRYSITGTTATLTLDNAVNNNQTVTLGYTSPSSGSMITDSVGNALATFTGQTVTNNTPNVPPSIASISRQTPATSPTRADTLTWRVTFSEAVSNVNNADFIVNNAGNPSISVARDGSNNVWDVTASGGNLADLTGTVTLGLSSSQDIKDVDDATLVSTLPGGGENTYVLDNTAPVVDLARTSGGILVVTFNEGMASTRADNSAWRIDVDSGTAPTINSYTVAGSTATFTLSGVIDSEQTVTLSYNRPGSGNVLTDSVGNALETFTNQAVINDTPPTFGDQNQADLNLVQGIAMTPVTLPEASDGDGVLQYRITPSLPSGLRFDAATRQISGTPGIVGTTQHRYIVSDSDNNTSAEDQASLNFAINVVIGPTTRAAQAWVSRFGRSVGEQTVEGIRQRVRAVGDSQSSAVQQQVRLGGQAIDPSQPLSNTAAGLLRQLDQRDSSNLLYGSSFSISGIQGGGQLSLWGQGAYSDFSAQEIGLDLEGRVNSLLLGSDYRQDNWTIGALLSRSNGNGDYRESRASGRLKSSLTSIVPWGSIQMSQELSVWGAIGQGQGELQIDPEQESQIKTDLDWQMLAGGVQSRLIKPDEGNPLGLSLTGDLLWTDTTTDRVARLQAIEGETRRVRVGLQADWLSSRELTPRLELGIRHDSGDAETGLGIELGGGLAWQDDRGNRVEFNGRSLLGHDDSGFRDWGVSIVAQHDARPSSHRGFSARLSHQLGTSAEGGVERLFNEHDLSPEQPIAGHRWELEMAYGMVRERGLTGSGYTALSGGAGSGLGWRVGYRLQPERTSEFEVDLHVLDAREVDEADPGVGLRFIWR